MNRVYLYPTEFRDVRTGRSTFGYRLCDDAAMTYGNHWDDIPEDDLEVLRRVFNEDGHEEHGIFDYLVENRRGLYIGENFYDWDQIKGIIRPWGDDDEGLVEEPEQDGS